MTDNTKMSGISKKMAMVIYDNAEVSILERSANEIAQDVINAAWTKFDIEDEKTWPTHEGLSFVMCKQFVNPHIATFHLGIWRCLDYKSSPEITVTEYADPQNLKRSEIL